MFSDMLAALFMIMANSWCHLKPELAMIMTLPAV
jgi:hypothetical protein